MATVRLSKDLVKIIIKTAKVQMQFGVEKAKGAVPDTAWGQRIYERLFAEHIQFILQAPPGWLKTVKALQVSAIDNPAGQIPCNLSFEFFTPQPWPVSFRETGLARIHSSWNDIIVLKDHDIWNDFRDEVLAYNARLAAATRRQDEFVGMVQGLLGTYTTLGPALKAWPALWELLPDDVKNKHREVTTREKTEVVLKVDVDKLTAMSTALKFGL